jgi:fusion and transport protein UGO1
LQPLIHNGLVTVFHPAALYSAPYIFPPYASALALPVASHLLTGLLLSPLDLVRTRLIVQSFNERHATYRGPFDALRRIHRDEGGLAGMFLHPHLLLPALVDNTLRPLLALGLPPLLARALFPAALAPDTHPLAWAVVEALAACAGFCVALPFETVRRRLQVQPRGAARALRACVETRPVPYNGIVDALWHILTEERSDLPLRPRRAKKAASKGKGREGADVADEEEDVPQSRWRHTGLGQLYRGLGMRLAASAMVFVVGLTMGEGDIDAGWAEL